MILFRIVKGIVSANKPNKIFPIIEIIKLIQFWQSLCRVNPLSEIPKSPINSKDRRAKVSAKIKTIVIAVIIPV